MSISRPASRVVVTGAGGFVGSRLLAHCARTTPTLAVVRSGGAAPAEASAVLEADLADGLPDAPAFRGASVVHAAAVMGASEETPLWRGNVDATFHVMAWAARHGAPHVVLLSSGGVYPYARDHWHVETDPVAPIGFYGHTKWIAEQTARALALQHGIALTIVRLFYPYGPGQARGLLPFVARAVLGGSPLTIHARGAPRVNPVHVDDVTRALAAMLETPAGVRVFNLAGREAIAFREIVQRFERHLGRSAVLREVEEDPGDLLGDAGLLARTLGWRPEHDLRDMPAVVCGGE